MATLFCPSCSNLLVISSETGFNKWACNTCPYEFPITKQMTSRTRLERKQVDDVLGGEEMWKHADSIAGEHLPGSFLLRACRDPPYGSSCWIGVYEPSLISASLTIHAWAFTPSVQLLAKSANTAEPTSISSKSDPLTSP